MATITLKGNEIQTVGNLPKPGEAAPDFTLVKSDLSEISLKDYRGKTVILNIFTTIDTPVCATATRRFNSEADKLDNVAVLCISADLPFALSRFCGAEGLETVTPLSVFRSPDFGKAYGQTITSGPLAGLLARSVVVVDPEGKVNYTEQVPEIAQEPNYEAVLSLLS